MEIKNGEITAYVEFLQKLNLKSRASRGRTKLIKLLEKKIEEYNTDISSLHCLNIAKTSSHSASFNSRLDILGKNVSIGTPI